MSKPDPSTCNIASCRRNAECMYTPCRQRPENAPKVGDGTPEAALAIGEHAFLAGYHAGFNASKQCNGGGNGYAAEIAWSAYEPPEHIKDLS